MDGKDPEQTVWMCRLIWAIFSIIPEVNFSRGLVDSGTVQVVDYEVFNL